MAIEERKRHGRQRASSDGMETAAVCRRWMFIDGQASDKILIAAIF